MLRWMMALAGLFLAVFAVVALSGPGQFDISDGWVRYEVARSLVEHGDVNIRDAHRPPYKIGWAVRPAGMPGGIAITGSRNRRRAWPRSWPPTPPGR